MSRFWNLSNNGKELYHQRSNITKTLTMTVKDCLTQFKEKDNEKRIWFFA